MQLFPPCENPVLDLWDTICSEVACLFDKREIKYSSVNLVRFRWVEKKEDIKDDEDVSINTVVDPCKTEVITPLTIWVGVLPDILTGEVAFLSSKDILALLEDRGIFDVDIAYCESVVRDFKGPRLFAPVTDLNHLKTIIDPVTTALSLSIAGLKTLHNEGTMGVYLGRVTVITPLRLVTSCCLDMKAIWNTNAAHSFLQEDFDLTYKAGHKEVAQMAPNHSAISSSPPRTVSVP